MTALRISLLAKSVFGTLIVFLFGSCAAFTSLRTQAERQSGYTYIPLDPFPVQIMLDEKAEDPNASKLSAREILGSLPDNAVRTSVQKIDVSGSVKYGPAVVATAGSSYLVTVDYINADTSNVRLWIAKSAEKKLGGRVYFLPNEPISDAYIPGSEFYHVSTEAPLASPDSKYYAEFSIPVYVGVGLRIMADITALKQNVNISGLGSIGAEAEAKAIRGSLVVQTLGVNGRSISAALPIQSELNQTTAQNAIVAVGAVKALLYEEETAIAPRVVGMYLPLQGNTGLVNAIVSQISKEPIRWRRPQRPLLSAKSESGPK